MRIGTTREIKNHEYRVGLTPESAAEAVHHGHEVIVESGAGAGIAACTCAGAYFPSASSSPGWVTWHSGSVSSSRSASASSRSPSRDSSSWSKSTPFSPAHIRSSSHQKCCPTIQMICWMDTKMDTKLDSATLVGDHRRIGRAQPLPPICCSIPTSNSFQSTGGKRDRSGRNRVASLT